MTGERETGLPKGGRAEGSVAGPRRGWAGLGWGSPEKGRPTRSENGVPPPASPQLTEHQHGTMAHHGGATRSPVPRAGEPAEASGEREPQRSPENAASSGLTPKPATFRVAANQRTRLTDRHENKPIGVLGPAPYARTAGQA